MSASTWDPLYLLDDVGESRIRADSRTELNAPEVPSSETSPIELERTEHGGEAGNKGPWYCIGFAIGRRPVCVLIMAVAVTICSFSPAKNNEPGTRA